MSPDQLLCWLEMGACYKDKVMKKKVIFVYLNLEDCHVSGISVYYHWKGQHRAWKVWT